MRIIVACALVSLNMLCSATAQDYYTTNRAGGAACFTEKAYDEYMDAAIHAHKTRDASWMISLYKSGVCIRLRSGLRVTLKDYSMWGKSQIYVHPPDGGAPVVVWTANENFTK